MARLLHLWPFFCLILATLPATITWAGEARLAVAANFIPVAHELAADYEARSGHRIRISSGSTGKLYAQIRQGAPFDVFLAADQATPQRLLDEGLAVPGTLHDYALGRLVLLSAHAGIGQASETLLRGHDFRTFAIANPRLAPYGVAAREVLAHVGRLDALEPRFVLGENIAQAAQYIVSGNADAGLVPWSLALALPADTPTSAWLVPAGWHAPIVQSAVLLKHGEHNPAASGFLDYLQEPFAGERIARHGYGEGPQPAGSQGPTETESPSGSDRNHSSN